MIRAAKDAEYELKDFLERDEKLIWTGKPKEGLLLRKGDSYMIPFSLMWGGFAIFWETMAISMGAPIFFWLWGIPFVLIGLYLIVGRFFVDARVRKNTAYGITQDRIIIRSGIFSKSIQSIHIGTLSGVTLQEKDDRTGTVVLGDEGRMASAFRGAPFPNTSQRLAPALDMIPDARKVYRLITEIQSGKLNVSTF